MTEYTSPSVNCGALPYSKHYRLPKKKAVKREVLLSKYALRGLQLCNPDPVSYQPDAFKPSTVSKIIDVKPRINDLSSGGEDAYAVHQRGIILHTERYTWSSPKEKTMTQNERLAAEECFIRKAKYLKQLSEKRIKVQDKKLILEGENLIPNQSMTKPDFFKIDSETFHFSPDDSKLINPPAPMVTPYIDDLDMETIILQQPVSMDVQKIKLKLREPSSDDSGNQNQSQQDNNVTKSNDLRTLYDKLPPITGGKLSQQSNESFDFETAFKKSERVNKSKDRIDKYVMGGVSVKFNERSDIQAELKFLKSIILPTEARDLYVGRGIRLPKTHATNKAKVKVDIDVSKKKENSFILETSGGGSITINTNTPTSYGISSEMENNQEGNNENENFVKQFQSLQPDSDRLLNVNAVSDFMKNDGVLSEKELRILMNVFSSDEMVNQKQFCSICQCKENIPKLRPDIRDAINQFDDTKIITLESILKAELNQWTVSSTITSVIGKVSDAFETEFDSAEAESELLEFRKLLSPSSDSPQSETSIPNDHLLLFIIYFLQKRTNAQ